MDKVFSIAPMMEWTDRHCRFFHRLLTRRALLYTEMITTGAVLYGDRARLMGFDRAEHPVALQLGGSDPRQLAQCARIAADLGYDVDFVTEATCTFPIGALSTDAIIERTEAVLRNRFARIATVNDVKEGMLVSAK